MSHGAAARLQKQCAHSQFPLAAMTLDAQQVDAQQQFAAILADAQRQFAATLADAAARGHCDASSARRHDSLAAFADPPMASVQDLQRELFKHNAEFAAFRDHHRPILDAVAAALGPVETVGRVAADVASHAFAPSQTIFAAALFLVNAARDVSSAYDSIVDLFVQLKEFTECLDVCVKHPMSRALREKLVNVLTALFEVLVLARREVRRGRLKAYLMHLVGAETPVELALNRLIHAARHQVVVDTYGIACDIRDHMHGAMPSARDRLRERLRPTPFPVDFYNAFRRSTVPSTGDWILDDEGLGAWLGGDVPYLWIYGNAGTGKSYLTARIIAWARDQADAVPGMPGIGCFFFRANNAETRSVAQALRDVACQLSQQDDDYCKHLMERLHSRDDIKTVASAFRELFALPSPPDAAKAVASTKYIFLDGIDEANQDEAKELLSMLAPTMDGDGLPQPACAPCFRFALVGRSYLTDDITATLDPTPPHQMLASLQVTPDRNADDVKAFIAHNVAQSRVLHHTSPDTKATVMRALERQADGLFIVAKFMLDDVNRKSHQSSILESVEAYPREIDGVLRKTLANLSKTISDEEARDLNEMLRWVTCAEEPLTLEQLEAVLTLRFGGPPLFLEESLRRQYACFFDVEREDGLTTDDLVKDFERTQRDINRRRRQRGLSPGGGSGSGSGCISPVGRGGLDRPSSPALRQASPRSSAAGLPSPGSSATKLPSPRSSVTMLPRPASPASGQPSSSSPALSSEVSEGDFEFLSNKSTTRVTFFHTAVRDFFRRNYGRPGETVEGCPMVGFDMDEARVDILTTCLGVFTERQRLAGLDTGGGREALRQYAARYWQEHVAALDPATVPAGRRRVVRAQLHQMVTDEATMYEWSMLHENSLGVLTDGSIRGLQRWFSDADVVQGLGAKGRAFAERAAERAAALCEPMGRLYARAWLGDGWRRGRVPALFCFKIVQNVALTDDGYDWSHADVHWPDVAVEERMARATRWAAQPRTAHSLRRMGSTYAGLGMHAEARRHYSEADALDATGKK